MPLQTKYEKQSFGGGELSRVLWNRNDLARHQVAYRYGENFVVLVEGGVARAPGTRFVTELRNEAQQGLLVPFKSRRQDSLMLVYNGGYGRVMKGQGIVESSPGVAYEFAIPFAEADLDDLRYAGSVDVQFYAWSGAPQTVSRYADDDFRVAGYAATHGPVLAQNIDKAKKIVAAGVTGTVDLTADFDIFDAGHVGSLWRFDESDLSTIGYWTANESVTCVLASATSYAAANMRRFRNNVYAAIAPGSGFPGAYSAGSNAPTHEEGDYSSGGTNNVTWRFLYKGYGFARITAVTDARHATAEVVDRLPDSVATTAGYRWSEGAWSDVRGWPDNVFLHEGRLVWCMADEFYITRAGSYYDFETDSTDGSAIIGRMGASQDGSRQIIQWVLSSGVFVIGTEDVEWIGRAPGAYDAVTAANLRLMPDEGEGSAKHRPATVRGGAAFIGTNRKRLHYAKLDRLAEALDVQDATTFARQILRGKARELAWQRNPNNLLWVRCADGQCRTLTFEPRQQSLAWARQKRINFFAERIACKPDDAGEDDELWLIVRRTIDGVSRRYIEKLMPFFEPEDDDNPTCAGAWFVDCGIEYQGLAQTHFTGASHLKGQTCRVFADGAMREDVTIAADGSFTLQYPAEHVVVGVPLDAKLRLLPFETSVRNGTSRGLPKQARGVYVNYCDAAGGRISVNGSRPVRVFEYGKVEEGDPLPARTGGSLVTVLSASDREIDILLECNDALPFTWTGVTPFVDVTEQP